MRDIPVFTTENGVATLTLKKIPYSKEAFVQIHSSGECDLFLEECINVCKMAGADRIYASGHPALTQYDLHTAVLRYKIAAERFPKTDAVLKVIEPAQINDWRSIYNRKMLFVPGAACFTDADVRDLVDAQRAFFVYRNAQLLGIGVVSEHRIDAVASVQTGAGKDIVLALLHHMGTDSAELEVASTNQKAIALYESLGFRFCGEKIRWYKIHAC